MNIVNPIFINLNTPRNILLCTLSIDLATLRKICIAIILTKIVNNDVKLRTQNIS